MTAPKTKADRHGVQKLCACGEVNWPRCLHSWYLRWTPDSGPLTGKRQQIPLDTVIGSHIVAERRARELAATIQAQLRAGTFRAPDSPRHALAPAPTAAPVLTVADLGALYFQRWRSLRTGQPLPTSERQKWDNLCTQQITRRGTTTPVAIGTVPAASLTSVDIEDYRGAYADKRLVTIMDQTGRHYTAERGGTKAVNRAVSRLRAVYNWAVPLRHVEATPFVHGGVRLIRKYKELRRHRKLRPGERAALLQRAYPRLKDLLGFVLGTACRKDEALGLRWYQVNWTTNEILFDKTKTRKARTIPMFAAVRAILEQRRLDPDGIPYGPMQYVFGSVDGKKRSIETAWTTLRVRIAGYTGPLYDKHTHKLLPAAQEVLTLQDLHFHDLRREAGCQFVKEGMDLRAVQAMLGHETLAQTSAYLDLEQEALHSEVARLDAQRIKTAAAAATHGTAEAQDTLVKLVRAGKEIEQAIEVPGESGGN